MTEDHPIMNTNTTRESDESDVDGNEHEQYKGRKGGSGRKSNEEVDRGSG